MILSPAKVNLFLRILSRRKDGYHEIASLFQAVSLFDKIYYKFSDEDSLTCTDPCLPCDDSNLIFKAMVAFKRKTGLRFSLNLHLEKNIPMEAGLGGGSSNAATTLFLCNSLHDFPLKDHELKEIASQLGSDVAFFFSRGAAFCTGRGECVESLSSFTTHKKLWIVKPLRGLSTQIVYSGFKKEHCSPSDPQTLLKDFLLGNFHCVNDLEGSAFKALPFLKKLKSNLLDQGYESVVMTGSGTAFICIGDNPPIVDSEVNCYPVSFSHRKEGEWYS